MGRKKRTDTVSEMITLRLSADERTLVDDLQSRKGFSTRSETIRWAIVSAAQAPTPSPRLDARGLAKRILDRIKTVEDRPLADGEVLLRAVDLSLLPSEDVESIILPALERLVRKQVSAHGWPYPTTGDSVDDVLRDIRDNGVEGPNYTGMGRTGVSFLQARIPAFWQTRKGPVESTRNPRVLRELLQHMLGLSSAQNPVDFSLAAFRVGMTRQHKAVSFFRPAVAAGIYRKWIDVEHPRVWDPSAGFGARMLGFFAAYPGGTYVAHEPASATHRDLSALAQEMPGTVVLHKQGSEFAQWQEGEFDLVFTSPPYFDTEKYFDEPGQVWVTYRDVEAWRDQQVHPTLQQAARGVKLGGFVIININQRHRATIVLEAMRVGLRLHTEENLVLRRSSLAKRWGNNKGTQLEPILVFQKPEVVDAP